METLTSYNNDAVDHAIIIMKVKCGICGQTTDEFTTLTDDPKNGIFCHDCWNKHRDDIRKDAGMRAKPHVV